MTTNDDTAPATQGDIQYLANLVSANTQKVEKFGLRFHALGHRFDALELQMERSFSEIKNMFLKMTEHVSKSDQMLVNHEDRIRTLGMAA